MTTVPHLRDAAPPRKESEVQKAILDYLSHVPGVVAWRSNAGAVAAEHKGARRFVRFGFPGMSDIIGWAHWCGRLKALRHHIPAAENCDSCSARFLAIEVKAPSKMPTPAQESFLRHVQASGGIAILAYSVEDVRKGLGL